MPRHGKETGKTGSAAENSTATAFGKNGGAAPSRAAASGLRGRPD
jgi:hypothetical protein